MYRVGLRFAKSRLAEQRLAAAVDFCPVDGRAVGVRLAGRLYPGRDAVVPRAAARFVPGGGRRRLLV